MSATHSPAASTPPTMGASVKLEAVVICVRDAHPLLLSIPQADQNALAALPGRTLSDAQSTLEREIRVAVAEQTGIVVGYAEQLYSFGDLARSTGPLRELSIAYLALVRDSLQPRAAQWQSLYDFLPWEDWRRGRPALWAPMCQKLRVAALHPAQHERIDVYFGQPAANDVIDHERVLERYELLWELNVLPDLPAAQLLGDHRRMLACALGRLRGKLKYRPVVFELLPDSFTMLQLQSTIEALIGHTVHKQNFRRLVEQGGLLESCGARVLVQRGRPAELFRFRRDVLRERPAPGLKVSTQRAV